MPKRFCAQCGASTLAGARYCAECGASLGKPPGAGAGGWRLTLAGSAVLLVFLGAGLAVWTAILRPAGPPPGPGARGPAAAARPGAGEAARIELPGEVRSFMEKLAAEAKEKPEDVDTWMRLAQVNARAAQLDPTFQRDAIAAFEHVLSLAPKNPDALRGLANAHYDRSDHQKAIPAYEQYLALRPEDESARTDLGTMYLYSGQPERAIATYKEVLEQNPSFLQAHYNLAVTYHGQGDDKAALGELEIARGLASEDAIRRQIDDMIASLKGGTAGTPRAPDGAQSPFQGAVEEAFRESPIMGARIVRFEWASPAEGRVLVRDFPMEGMPDDVRGKFTDRLAHELLRARDSHPVEGPVRVEIADAATGKVMATLTP